ncbi:MAG: helix-turn-helix transcriptional regulator [Clostridia bacterium]|nr:helix-turn-helix transcriptional regulator [Clostridia bacterium]
MFSHIVLSLYGRCTMHKEWQIVNTIGVNRVYYVNSGTVRYNHGIKKYTLSPGMFYFFPQNLKFGLTLDDNTSFDHSFFDFTTVPPIKMDRMIELDPKKYPLIWSAARVAFDIAEAYPMFPVSQRNRHYNLAKSYLNNLLMLVNEIVPIETIDDPMMHFIIDYIHKNFHTDISISELADKLCLEKNFFIKKFKRYMDITPYQYIRNYRMNTAMSLIKSNRYNISKIAEMVGYADTASFSHAFKKMYDFYPNEVYKNKHLFF